MFRKILPAAAAVAFLTAVPFVAGTAWATGDRGAPACTNDGRGRVQLVALTADQRLTCFKDDRPQRARTIGAVTGLDGDTALLGIDVRPANGQLYGLGDQGGVYVLDPGSASARRVAKAATPTGPVVPAGTSFGVDFNPAADRLRVVSDTGQNLRINVDDGSTTVDTPLAYVPPTPPTGAVGAAYTNNDADPATATTLFDVDAVLDQLVIQSPPNLGSLAATGKLGVDTGPEVGLDIYSRVEKGTTVENITYASLSSRGASSFYAVKGLTGRANPRGAFPRGDVVIGIAVAPAK